MAAKADLVSFETLLVAIFPIKEKQLQGERNKDDKQLGDEVDAWRMFVYVLENFRNCVF